MLHETLLFSQNVLFPLFNCLLCLFAVALWGNPSCFFTQLVLQVQALVRLLCSLSLSLLSVWMCRCRCMCVCVFFSRPSLPSFLWRCWGNPNPVNLGDWFPPLLSCPWGPPHLHHTYTTFSDMKWWKCQCAVSKIDSPHAWLVLEARELAARSKHVLFLLPSLALPFL